VGERWEEDATTLEDRDAVDAAVVCAGGGHRDKRYHTQRLAALGERRGAAPPLPALLPPLLQPPRQCPPFCAPPVSLIASSSVA
jgi:hypothetical protein